MPAEPQPLEPIPPAPEGEHNLQVRLPADLYEWLRTQAFHQRRSMRALITEALEQYRNQVKQG